MSLLFNLYPLGNEHIPSQGVFEDDVPVPKVVVVDPMEQFGVSLFLGQNKQSPKARKKFIPPNKASNLQCVVSKTGLNYFLFEHSCLMFRYLF